MIGHKVKKQRVSAIEFKDVCKSYQHNKVLDHIKFTVSRGEFFGLVGVNGVGKSTLIKSLLDLCEIETGTIKIFGVTHTVNNARTDLTFLPEQFVPPYYLTGQHFLTYMLELYGNVYDSEQVQTICQVLDFPVSSLKQPVCDYSKGMAQKLGLAACLLSGKRLLVLDEPMTGLDPKARVYLQRYLLQQKAKGITLFFSTHLLADLETLCDRMAIMHEGRLQFVGSPASCCATFGSQNLEQAYLNCIGG